MNSDHYVQHLIQKYRLAVAIGVIQTKPEAKSIDQHITDLRNKVNDDKMEDMTICSDDFDMGFNDMVDLDDQLDTSQHSDTILKDFNDVHVSGDEKLGHTSTETIFANVVGLNKDNGGSQIQILNDENDIQSTFCETQTQADAYIARESLTDIDKTFCDSIALINRDDIVAIDKVCDNVTQLDTTQTTIDKTTCKNVQDYHTIDTDKTYCDSLIKLYQNKTANIENNVYENLNNTNISQREQHAKNITMIDLDRQYLDQTTAFDSQATELYSIHTFKEDYTHVSQSQTNHFDISKKYIKGISKRSDNQDMCNNIEDSLPMHVINTEFGNNIKDVNLVKKINKNLGKMSNTIQGEIDNFVQNTQITTSISILDNENENNHLQENTEFNYNFKDINLVKKINKKLNKENIAISVVTENINHKTQTATDVNNSINIRENKENKHNLEGNATNTEFEISFKDINLARKVSSNLDNFANVAMELDVDNFDLNTQADSNPRDASQNNDYTQKTKDAFTNENSDQILLNQFETKISQNIATVHEISKKCNDDMTMQDINFSQNDQDNLLRKENNNFTFNTPRDVSKTNVPTTENMAEQVLDFSQNLIPFESNKITNSTLEISKANIQNTEAITMQVCDFSQDIQTPSENKNPDIDVENESVSSEEISELVSFKVMEELNRVKACLNRRIERRMSIDSSLDSGYRSDSQGRSKSALQLSGNWVGQSAYCLYEHITRCPMVTTTQEIVEEISQVLGQLIDRLHEEESYPAFLEELLDHVDTLIRSIFTEEEMLLEKDEKIQRLFLLNKSVHIQKYSIEKLTDILENIHTSLTAKEDLHELTNIQEVENLSFIFHVLEVIIKKHIKTKKMDDSQTQSQDENCPKRSSISDIWRKKWNPNYKEESKLYCSLDKKCIYTKCSEVLNKIVVGCLDGYSLVAYAALQCFNLLQS